MRDRKESSPWFYVLIGCGCLTLMVIVAIVVIGIFSVRAAKNVQASIEDPAKRAEQVQEILGYDRLPEGYVPRFGISIPLVLRVAVLADQPPIDERLGGPTDRVFLYIRVANWVARDDDLKQIFEGDGNPAHAFDNWDQSDLRFRGHELIEEGTVTVDGRTIPYSAQRGELELDRAEVEGILSVFVVKCDDGKRPGLGAWLVPDSEDLTGTPADPQALAAFLSQFQLCL